MKINSKTEMYALYEKGKFGNKLQTWTNLNELMHSDYQGLVSMRYAGKWNNTSKVFGIPKSLAPEKSREWVKMGADPNLIKFNETPDDTKLTVQGEVCGSVNFLSLRYSHMKDRMSVAMKNDSHHAEGMLALAIIKQHMDENSYADFEVLREEYPDSIIEFSCYSINLGERPNRNTIFWEVRNY